MLGSRQGWRRRRRPVQQQLVALLCWTIIVVVASGADLDVTLAVINRRSPVHLRNCLRTLMGVISDGELSAGGGRGKGEGEGEGEREMEGGGRELSWEILVVETAPDGHASSKRDALLSTVADFPPSRPVLNRMADSGKSKNNRNRMESGGISSSSAKKSGLNVSQALSAAASEAAGEVIVWIDDSIEVKHGVLRGMMSAVAGSSSVGVVGAEVWEPDGVLFHAGVDFDFGKRDDARGWGGGMSISSGGTGYGSSSTTYGNSHILSSSSASSPSSWEAWRGENRMDGYKPQEKNRMDGYKPQENRMDGYKPQENRMDGYKPQDFGSESDDGSSRDQKGADYRRPFDPEGDMWKEESTGGASNRAVAVAAAKSMPGVESIVAYHPHIGMPPHVVESVRRRSEGDAKESSALERVKAVWDGLMAVRLSTLEGVGGLSFSVRDAMVGVDLCLKMRAAKYKVLLYHGHHAMHMESEKGDRGRGMIWRDGAGMYIGDELESRYGRDLAAWIKRGYKTDVPIAWNMECGGGEVLGLTTEAVNLLRALNRRLYVIAIASSVHLCADVLEEHFPPAVSGQIIRMLHRKVHPHSPLIQVLHRDPGRYSSFRDIGMGSHNGPIYRVGRSMYETDGVPSKWVRPANCMVHAIWVPTDFNRATFAEGGVREAKISVLGETIDFDHFSRGPRVEGSQGDRRGGAQGARFQGAYLYGKEPLLPSCSDVRLGQGMGEARHDQGRACFRFLSVFKWEDRKGWDVLLQSYWLEFSADEDVALYLVSRPDRDNVAKYERLRKLVCEAKYPGLINKKNKKNRNNSSNDNSNSKSEEEEEEEVVEEERCLLAPVHFVVGHVPYEKLPALYSEADAFVLPSRGEGWGLPLMEAMSLGVPTIGTGWGGSSEFMGWGDDTWMVPISRLQASWAVNVTKLQTPEDEDAPPETIEDERAQDEASGFDEEEVVWGVGFRVTGGEEYDSGRGLDELVWGDGGRRGGSRGEVKSKEKARYAMPSVGGLRSIMREVYSDPEEARVRASTARSRIEDRYGADGISDSFTALVEGIRESGFPGKFPPFGGECDDQDSFQNSGRRSSSSSSGFRFDDDSYTSNNYGDYVEGLPPPPSRGSSSSGPGSHWDTPRPWI